MPSSNNTSILVSRHTRSTTLCRTRMRPCAEGFKMRYSFFCCDLVLLFTPAEIPQVYASCVVIQTPSRLRHTCHATIKTAGSPALRKPLFGFLYACRLPFCHRIWRALGTSRAQRPRGPAIIQHSLGLRWCQVGVDSIETFSIVDGKAIAKSSPQVHPTPSGS